MQHITAQFKDGRKVAYTMAVWNLLVSDKDVICIYDGETGEIFFYR